ncbi:DUF1097 family protein [Nocardioides kongjuensis]|uniref:DUF1097 domain-containing protein n=1 Tax=Nocardioides kongjuensis TaxID=349522 RepID=A0A852RJ42_9ACTN|nr:DUF1097 family protein [Nocardioides kongjuensis]NYD29346.1 hypothetical protein [Nocardioides kongjuensis]
MLQRLRATLPLSLSIAVLAAVWVDVSLNFTFHWATAGDLGNGLALPGNLQLIAPAAFVSWATFFAAGADGSAMRKAIASSLSGCVGAFALMAMGPKVAGLPDFWGLAVVVGVIATIVVLASAAGEWYFVPGVFGAFASTVFWWIATGLDGWAPGGGGAANTLKALGDPTTAGAGAFGGVLSTPILWVAISTFASLLCGCLLGLMSVKLAGVLGSVIGPKEQ